MRRFSPRRTPSPPTTDQAVQAPTTDQAVKEPTKDEAIERLIQFTNNLSLSQPTQPLRRPRKVDFSEVASIVTTVAKNAEETIPTANAVTLQKMDVEYEEKTPHVTPSSLPAFPTMDAPQTPSYQAAPTAARSHSPLPRITQPKSTILTKRGRDHSPPVAPPSGEAGEDRLKRYKAAPPALGPRPATPVKSPSPFSL